MKSGFFRTPESSQSQGRVTIHVVDGRNPANQLRLVLKNPRWLRWLFGISEPSTVEIPSRVMKLPSTVGKVRIQKDSLNHQVPELNLRRLFLGGGFSPT